MAKKKRNTGWITVLILGVIVALFVFIFVTKDSRGKLSQTTGQTGQEETAEGTEGQAPGASENKPDDNGTTEGASGNETEETIVRKIDNSKQYLGLYANEPQLVKPVEDSINTLGWFDTVDSPSKNKIAMCLDEHRYTAFITLEPVNMPLGDIVAGTFDDELTAYLENLSAGDRVNTELFIRFAHEMEMRDIYKTPWYPWQSWDSELYVEAWRHVVTLGREVAPNVKWVWSPNRADEFTIPYYPGDDYVDYVSMSLNDVADRPSFAEFYEEIGRRDYLEAYNKPIIIGECAKSGADPQVRADYIAGALDFIRDYEGCIGIMFFNEDVEESRQFRFTDEPTIVDTFNEHAATWSRK
ncbi:MAG: glycosyl hydrolase [Lachnospiraceae bacterium]|nr:glycosyl hydrolase [Lachnospiraceae bacterium]